MIGARGVEESFGWEQEIDEGPNARPLPEHLRRDEPDVKNGVDFGRRGKTADQVLVGPRSARTAFVELEPENYFLGQVPILEDDGFLLTESNAILKYVAQKKELQLYPSEPAAQARVDCSFGFLRTFARTIASWGCTPKCCRRFRI